MRQADKIRALVLERYVATARAAGRSKVEIVSGDVARLFGRRNRMPAVCSALDAQVFAALARASHISRSGPRFGATARWIVTLTPIAPRSWVRALLDGLRPSDPPPAPGAAA